ncbi:hypothetical protein Clacol_004617 [Clathrus columnatus]|uniref:Uncharacterized protein n=1 Tax=Clathrus columnatus TaxID=1419009 RepID=A0AAV5ABI8_9AGAM|nr:hypothetical protein Clacol_004617 [Clathrus columnatus]
MCEVERTTWGNATNYFRLFSRATTLQIEHTLQGALARYFVKFVGLNMSLHVSAVPFLPQAASYIKNQLDSSASNLGALPLNIGFKAETPQITNSISTTQDSPSPYFPYESTLDEYTATPSIPSTQDEWVPNTDSDIPHCYIDIASFDTPQTLEKYVIKIGQFYGSAFPSCRHLLFFGSEKDVMYHIVEAHIEPTQKRFSASGTEFDESEEADQHASQSIISATARKTELSTLAVPMPLNAFLNSAESIYYTVSIAGRVVVGLCGNAFIFIPLLEEAADAVLKPYNSLPSHSLTDTLYHLDSFRAEYGSKLFPGVNMTIENTKVLLKFLERD